jgi:hypothetical protein
MPETFWARATRPYRNSTFNLGLGLILNSCSLIIVNLQLLRNIYP